MAKVYVGRERQVQRWDFRPKIPNQACRKVSYNGGQAHECGAATEGKVYCPSCAHKLLTLTDRQSPEQPAPKAYAWTQNQIFPRKRA
jgi:hypothetical protein